MFFLSTFILTNTRSSSWQAYKQKLLTSLPQTFFLKNHKDEYIGKPIDVRNLQTMMSITFQIKNPARLPAKQPATTAGVLNFGLV